ncbi:hypothetical protein EK21DRAFT_90134 [Setomelanomma holmii]|uniref:Uncharacterized protein n=1 Tax=Setomelanomma holmii TaxID=210430 RepID=A0A9P4H8Y8_9PLEO|nr:hypothetical protein EK21DRAFT_90134 [Setomelanomma holmii]
MFNRMASLSLCGPVFPSQFFAVCCATSPWLVEPGLKRELRIVNRAGDRLTSISIQFTRLNILHLDTICQRLFCSKSRQSKPEEKRCIKVDLHLVACISTTRRQGKLRMTGSDMQAVNIGCGKRRVVACTSDVRTRRCCTSYWSGQPGLQ